MKKCSFFEVPKRWIKGALMLTLLLILPVFFGCKFIPDSDPDSGSTDPLTRIVNEFGSSVVNIVAAGSGSGSGVILSEDGYILTNDHVIKGANSLEVHMADKRTLKAKLIGRDSRMDLAVIKVDGDNLRPAMLSDSEKVSKATEVIAIGNAKGVENSVTKGIISNVDIEVDDGQNIKKCLQTDTSINPGNSGGALLNMQGKVIGITTMVLRDSENVGYAIPSSDAKKIADQLIDKGYISYPYLGVNAVNEQAETKDGTISCIMIHDIMDDSPAAKAGLQVNDIIYQVNGVRVETVSKLRDQLNNTGIGSIVSVYVLRKTKQGLQQGTIQVKLDELPKGYYTIDWS